jgi:hypothetical protein
LAWPRWIEALAACIAIAAVLPLFKLVSVNEQGRDARFADDGLALVGLPSPVLPALCRGYGASASSVVVTARASTLGAFTAAAPSGLTYDRCSTALLVRATGARGDGAVLRVPPRLCPPG